MGGGGAGQGFERGSSGSTTGVSSILKRPIST